MMGDATGWLTLQGAPPPPERQRKAPWHWGMAALLAVTIASAALGGGVALWSMSAPTPPGEAPHVQMPVAAPAPPVVAVAAAAPLTPTMTPRSRTVEVVVDDGPFRGIAWACGGEAGRVTIVDGRASFLRHSELCTVRLLGGAAVERDVTGPGDVRCTWRGADWRCRTVSDRPELPRGDLEAGVSVAADVAEARHKERADAPLVAQSQEQAPARGVERAVDGRLVDEEEGDVLGEASGPGDADAAPGVELVGKGVLDSGESDAFEGTAGAFFSLRAAESAKG